MSVAVSDYFFTLNEELYGPMANNLRMMLLYMAITEIIICAYCHMTKTFQIIPVAGFFLIMAIGSLKFYGNINDVEVDSNFFLFLLYTGLSHIAFGIMASMEKDNLREDYREHRNLTH
ncbi:MAG: hypothetical protein ACU84H_03290 [Gammaproteobacteria bacterium]